MNEELEDSEEFQRIKRLLVANWHERLCLLHELEQLFPTQLGCFWDIREDPYTDSADPRVEVHSIHEDNDE